MKRFLHHTLLVTAAISLVGSATAQQPTGALPTPPAAPVPLPTDAVPPLKSDATAPLPSDLAPAAPVPALPTAPAAATAPPAATGDASDDSAFSFGNEPYSLLFTTDQVAAMKGALRTFEGIRSSSGASGDVQVTEALPVAAPQILEPEAYPVFTLSSIAFHTPTDWTVWVNNARITPKSNDGEVRVVTVKPDRVWFAWSPTYSQAVVERYRKKLYATTEKVSHRMTQPNTTSLAADGSVLFSLKPNQSFVAGYFSTFEGKVAAPSLPPLAPPEAGSNNMTVDQAAQIKGLLDPSTTTAPVDADRKKMDEMMNNQHGMFPHAPARGTTQP